MGRLFWLIGGLILIPALIYATDYTGTATGPELDYVHGVTSGIQAQINAKLTANAVEYSNGTCTTAKTISAANGNHQSVTLTAGDACVLTLTGPSSGTSTVTLRIIQASTATGTISTNSLCYWVGTVPTITTSSGAQDFISIYFFGGTYPACSTIGQNVTLQ